MDKLDGVSSRAPQETGDHFQQKSFRLIVVCGEESILVLCFVFRFFVDAIMLFLSEICKVARLRVLRGSRL